MPESEYPQTFESITAWADQHGVPVIEARVRYAQYMVLRAIAGSRILRRTLVFKGGNALDFVWQPNRSTTDLDFSIDASATSQALGEVVLASLLQGALAANSRTLGGTFVVHRVERQPRGEGKTFVTFEARIGYALQDEHRLRQRMLSGEPSSNVIGLDLSLNGPICATADVALDVDHRLRVSTVEDIIAEKLRALLQQPIRNRTRRQDLLDIAVVTQERADLNRTQVADFLLRKAAARNVPVTRAAVCNPDVIERARLGYDRLEPTTRIAFIPFEEAMSTLLQLVDALDIPEE
jgi:hypothetical protein